MKVRIGSVGSLTRIATENVQGDFQGMLKWQSRRDPREPEAKLNAAINDLGLQVGGYVSAPPLEHFDEELDRRATVLSTHGKLIDLARIVIQ